MAPCQLRNLFLEFWKLAQKYQLIYMFLNVSQKCFGSFEKKKVILEGRLGTSL